MSADHLKGKIGHLTEEQTAALEEFRKLVTEEGLYTPGDPPSHSDAALLRFLRARVYDPPKALEQFSDYCKWFKELDVDNLYREYDVEDFERGKHYYPMWIGRRDKYGYPIHLFRVASMVPERLSELNSYSLEHRYKRIVALTEYMTRGTAALSSTLPSITYPTPIDCATNIIDLGGVPFSLVWSLRTHLQQAATLGNQRYPETMGNTWVINAPSFFSTVWGWLKSWFDENTRNKIKILSKSELHLLLEGVDIENIPKAYGGELDWEYDDPPNLDEPAKAALAVFGGTVPRGPWEVIHGVPMMSKDVQKGGTRKEDVQNGVISNGHSKDSAAVVNDQEAPDP